MIKIICVGKIKEKYFQEAIKEYEKRLKKYININIVELPDYNFDTAKTILEEGKSILSKITSKDYVVALDINGKKFDSLNFSKFVDINLPNNLTFIIGGSYGLSKEVLKRANSLISFSDLTFPHQLFRVILLEQIYRAFKIIKNESYHK